ncbi:MAG TPA: SGNH/GDSL hydrolase family protein [Thermoleophilaceae bacterium]
MLSLLLLLSVASPASAADDGLLSMLVMGDSYSAGNGAGDYYGAKGCWRSANNYGRVYQRLVEAPPYEQRAFVETVACSGDTTRELTRSKSGRPPQIEAVNGGYDVIFLTIGGNDLKFVDIVRYCLIDVTRDGANCGSLLGQAERALARRGLEQRIKDILQKISDRADPRAKVVLLGYPYLEGDPKYRLRSGRGGRTFIKVGSRLRTIGNLGDKIQSRVVGEMNSATNSRRFVFVKTKQLFNGPPSHELFAQRKNRHRWFIRPFSDANILKRDTWYHPNAKGWAEEAGLLLRDCRIPKRDPLQDAASPARQKLYFQCGETISSLDTDNPGEGPADVADTGNNEASAIAVAGENVFWTVAYPSVGVWRAGLGGKGARAEFAEASSPGASVATAQHLYWVDEGAIARASLDGSEVDRNFIPLPEQEGFGSVAEGLATDGRFLYFSRCGDSTVGRVGLDGSDPELYFIYVGDRECPQGLAVGGGYIYWTDLGLGEDDPNALGRASVDGENVDPQWLHVGGQLGPYQVVADSEFVYWMHGTSRADGGFSYIGRVRHDGSEFTPVFFEPDRAFALALAP